MSLLVSHLESRLGVVQGGWSKDPTGIELPFQVAEFRGGGQLEGSTSYGTIGLSRHLLSSPSGDGREMRLELIATTHSALAPARLPQALQTVGRTLLDRHLAILRGETFPLPGPVAPGSQLTALYAAVPGYFDEGFDAVELEDGAQAAIVWMVPISESERRFVTEKGWDAFEQEWAKRDPDLLHLERQPMC